MKILGHAFPPLNEKVIDGPWLRDGGIPVAHVLTESGPKMAHAGSYAWVENHWRNPWNRAYGSYGTPYAVD